MNCKTQLLREIQQLHFTMIELGLYLNNQPKNQEALTLFQQTKDQYEAARTSYEEQYGPLSYDGVHAGKDGWSWIDGPWPWKGED